MNFNLGFNSFVIFVFLFVGIATTVLTSVSNIGTTITEFIIIKILLEKAMKLSVYDLELSENLEKAFKNIISSDTVNFFF